MSYRSHCHAVIEEKNRLQDKGFLNSFCYAEIDANPNKLYIKMQTIYSPICIWQYIYYSKHALLSKPSFPQYSDFPTGQAFNLLHQNDPRKYKKNAMPKSRQDLSRLLSMVVNLVTKHYFGKERQYSAQNSGF